MMRLFALRKFVIQEKLQLQGFKISNKTQKTDIFNGETFSLEKP